jgi:thiosulfate dehydrogenase
VLQARFWTSLLILISFLVVGAVISVLFSQLISGKEASQIKTVAVVVQDEQRTSGINYRPPRPEDAPPDLREAVLLGYNIINDTQKYAGQYVGNKLSCSNCHFNGGISESGKNGGLSLVGVAAKYPMYRDRQKAPVDLVLRVNDCFERSMNGTIPPNTGKEMQAVMAYLHWISKDIPIYAQIPWLSSPKIKSDHKADTQAGQQVFAQNCAVCHGADGSGTLIAPPVWGSDSYNDGAGMSSPAALASFALNNMPKGNPILTPEQALDVGAFVDSRPRPHFVGK